MEKNKLVLLQKKQKKLQRILKNYPLAVSRLWNPYCHRWTGKGKKSNRDRGCGKEMRSIGNGIFICDTCNITEKRTSQRESLLSMGREAHLIGGGNRAGKTQLGAMLTVATAAGSKGTYH